MHFLTLLGRDVEIVVKRAPSVSSAGPRPRGCPYSKRRVFNYPILRQLISVCVVSAVDTVTQIALA
jgi:hypothetical protein